MTISVVIPSYNRASLVGATLDSVLAQTRPADEVLVVDDGSTDDTPAVLAGYAGAHPGRVRCHRQGNAGLSAARNVGLGLTRGDAVLMLDSDDLLLPGALAALGAALEAAPDAPLAYCRAQIVDGEGRVVERRWGPPGGDHDGDVWRALLVGNFIRSSGAALIRRTALDLVGPWDPAQEVEDWDMWLRLAERGPFARVQEPLFQYRLHGVTLSGNAWTMHRRSLRFYDHLLRRYRRDPAREPALRAVMRGVRAVRPGFLLEQAFSDLERGATSAALAKWLSALWLRPRYLVEVRGIVSAAARAGRILTGRRSAARVRRDVGRAEVHP